MAMVLATAHATAHLLPVLRYGSLEESLQKVRIVIQVLATQVECNQFLQVLRSCRERVIYMHRLQQIVDAFFAYKK